MTERRPTPWTSAQARVVAACDLVAAVVVLLAARAARGRDTLGAQLGWVDVAVLVLVGVVVANGCLFLFARRAVGARRLALLPDVVPTPATTSHEPSGTWWWLPGTVRAHVAGCPMIAGKPANPLDADGVRKGQLRRCEVCG